MRLYPPWAVLAPGEPAWLEERARFALGLDEEEEYSDVAVESPFKTPSWWSATMVGPFG